MDGILIINKEKGYTSRDVVNIISKKLGTKKVGHTGTLDPMATGVLVICIGKALKMCEELTNHDKDYIAEAILGIETDTLDIEGNIIKSESVNISFDKIKEVVNSFNGKYLQEVPKYSAVKVNGKKLYEYARNNINVALPKKEVNVKEISFIDIWKNNDKIHFTFKCNVSKGTYIRSLIRDIGVKLGCSATMSNLIRTRQGQFNINNACSIDDINNNNFKINSILDSFSNVKRIIMDEELLFKVKNGVPIDMFKGFDMAFMLDINNNLVALYKNKDFKARMYKYFM